MYTSSKQEIFDQLSSNNSDFIRTNTDSVIKLCVSKLIGDEISLCDIVEGLKHFLTNTSPTERAFGVQLLVDVLQNLSTTKVNDKELTYLSAFFVDRLKDHHSVVPHVIVGIIALVKQKNITSEDVKSLLCTLFQEVPCQAQILADRRNIYSLLKYCIVNKTKDVKEMNDEFILNFISAA
ncbi:MMS19 nucleotide excision repair protein-like [Armadillidium vulgare]|nr:MMS19 nucleotide excision repair protein-like [Armadillidium vulgare]